MYFLKADLGVGSTYCLSGETFGASGNRPV